MNRAFDKMVQSVRSIGKLLLQSRSVDVHREAPEGSRLIIMGNGPSLAVAIEKERASLDAYDTMAVNFAANTPQFFDLKPRYYTIADPHFYRATDDANVARLLENLSHVDWTMTLFVPATARVVKKLITNSNIKVETYNAIGVEGWSWLTNRAFSSRRGMPRPRNVLVPSIMIGIWLGYSEIYIAGADHSWTQSLSVADDNRVITNLPHFYADNEHEQARVKAVYADIPLHDLFLSYHIAFKAYHEIAPWARRRGVAVYNSTPGSFIDAFERRPLPGPR